MSIFAFRPEKPPSFARIVTVVFRFRQMYARTSQQKKELSGLRLPQYGCEKKVHETLLCTGDSGGSRNEKSSGSRFAPDMSLFFSQQ